MERQEFTRDMHCREIVLLFVALAFVAVVLFAGIGEADAKDVEVKVQWDADVIEYDEATGLPIHTPWENLGFFYRISGGGEYDYSSPALSLPQEYVDDRSEPTTTPLTVTVPDDQESTVFLVVRSQATVDGKSVNSEDSDEASVVINLLPLEVFAFTAVYNPALSTIDVTWPAGDLRVKEWVIYSGDASGGPWEELTRVDAGTTSTSIDIPVDEMFPPGVKTTKYFTMVSFGAYGVFSPNAGEVLITRDRTVPAPVVNLIINLTE